MTFMVYLEQHRNGWIIIWCMYLLINTCPHWLSQRKLFSRNLPVIFVLILRPKLLFNQNKPVKSCSKYCLPYIIVYRSHAGVPTYLHWKNLMKNEHWKYKCMQNEWTIYIPRTQKDYRKHIKTSEIGKI